MPYILFKVFNAVDINSIDEGGNDNAWWSFSEFSHGSHRLTTGKL